MIRLSDTVHELVTASAVTATRSMARKAALSAAIFGLLCGCDQQTSSDKPALPGADPVPEWQHKILEGRVNSLDKKLVQFTGREAILTPGDTEFQFIRGDAGNVSIALEGVESKGNGSEAKIAIGNTTAADFIKCGIYLRWGEVNKDSNPIYQKNLERRVSINGEIPGGAYISRSFTLPDLARNKLGFVEVSSLSCDSLKMRKAE